MGIYVYSLPACKCSNLKRHRHLDKVYMTVIALAVSRASAK